MIEQILHPYNLQKALQQVVSNKGSAGIDGLKTVQVADHFRNEKATLLRIPIKNNIQMSKRGLGCSSIAKHSRIPIKNKTK